METLVLSSTFEPIRRVPWQQAMTLWVGGRVEVLEEYANQLIRTARTVFKMPAVVRYIRGRHRRRGVVKFSRRNVHGRDKGRCQYCSASVSISESTFDHIIPRARGGLTSWENVVIACRPCNQRKASRTPDEARMPLMRKPFRPKTPTDLWSRMIEWRKSVHLKWRPYLGLGDE